MERAIGKKKIAMVIAFRDFRDEEYFIPKTILEGAGAIVSTFSTSLGSAIGIEGGEVQIPHLLKDLEPKNFDAVLFVGGRGAARHIEDPDFHRVARKTIKENKVFGAICIAPTIAARSGILAGKKATVWTSVMDRSAIKILEEGGAKYYQEDVVQDGNIVTANGPLAAQAFAQKIIEMVK